jgi:hypothetical protein
MYQQADRPHRLRRKPFPGRQNSDDKAAPWGISTALGCVLGKAGGKERLAYVTLSYFVSSHADGSSEAASYHALTKGCRRTALQ